MPGPQQFEQKVWDLAPAPEEPVPLAAVPEVPADGPSRSATAPEAEAARLPVEPVWNPEPLPPAADAAPVGAPMAAPVPGPKAPPDEAPARSPDPAMAAAVAAAPAPVSAAAPAWPEVETRAPTVDPDDDLPPRVSFMDPEGGRGFWHRRPVQIALGVLALLLAGLLAAQVLVQERNRLVLLEPATRPAVLALCRLAGCEVGPLRQIESIVIDSSSFGRLRSDAYRLSFGLRNQAPIDIAMPAIELSLTDTQDQALIRRVILPAEYGAPGPVLAAGADWSGTLAMNIRAGATTERIAGYRLLAFYP